MPVEPRAVTTRSSDAEAGDAPAAATEPGSGAAEAAREQSVDSGAAPMTSAEERMSGTGADAESAPGGPSLRDRVAAGRDWAAKTAVAGRAAASRAAERARSFDISLARRSIASALRAQVRRPSGWAAVALAACGPLLALLTYAALTNRRSFDDVWFQTLVLLDIAYLAIAIGLIANQVRRLIMARRAQSAGSKLHVRMVAIFAGVAAAPALMVAVFFFLVIQLGFESWFNDQVGSVVRNSREVAQAYAREHRETIASQTLTLSTELTAAAGRFLGGATDPRFAAYLQRATENSPFSDVYLLNSSGEVLAKGADSYLFTFTAPRFEDLIAAEAGQLVINQDRDANEMRGLIRLDGFFDAYLYVSRQVDGAVLASLEETSRGVRLYERLETNRDVWMARFAAIYLGFAVLVLLAAIYLGLWFAERLARPIGRLAFAAERVAGGDLTARVKEERGDDELSLLSKAFNRMTSEVRRKQEALREANRSSEDRRLFSEAVLSGVSAGVVALNGQGRIGLMNATASELLAVDPAKAAGRRLDEVAPEFEALLAAAMGETALTEEFGVTVGAAGAAIERPIRLVRGNVERELLARVTRRGDPLADAEAAGSGYVLTIDDLTDLVQAQRMAAWGDVARRIAHEIKNPLTPIQLAAERLRRKYGDRLGEDGETFVRYTDTIVRQTGDIGRMVDAFVRFAKMPSPKMAASDLAEILKEAVLLQEEARSHITYKVTIEPGGAPYRVRADRGLLTQAFTNLLQNAADALGARVAQDREAGTETGGEGAPPEIRVALSRAAEGAAQVLIEDNGIGLPATDRRRLLEPYVTTREKGAGLGLAIVSKIVEEHSGAFELGDAKPFAKDAKIGAAARIELPAFRPEEDAEADADSEKSPGSVAPGANLERSQEKALAP